MEIFQDFGNSSSTNITVSYVLNEDGELQVEIIPPTLRSKLRSSVTTISPLVEIRSFPLHGEISLHLIRGNATYNPHSDFYGTDSFIYSLRFDNEHEYVIQCHLTILPVNDAPHCSTHLFATFVEDEPQLIQFGLLGLVNDVDHDSSNILIPHLSSTFVHGSSAWVYWPPLV